MSFLSLGLLLAVTNVSLPGFASTTITGLDKYVRHYGATPMDITMDDLCPQDGRVYKTMSADQLSEVQGQLKLSLDSMLATKARFGEFSKDDSGDTSGKIERWYSRNNACLGTVEFLKAVQSKIAETQEIYFGKGISKFALNVASLGFRKSSGEKQQRYYSTMGEKVAKIELGIIENIKLNEDFLVTADTGVCAGKKIVVSGLALFAIDQGNFELVKSLFAEQAARVTYVGAGDLTRPETYGTFIDFYQPGDKACAMKVRETLNAKSHSTFHEPHQAIGVNRDGVLNYALPGGTISVNFGH